MPYDIWGNWKDPSPYTADQTRNPSDLDWAANNNAQDTNPLGPLNGASMGTQGGSSFLGALGGSILNGLSSLVNGTPIVNGLNAVSTTLNGAPLINLSTSHPGLSNYFNPGPGNVAMTPAEVYAMNHGFAGSPSGSDYGYGENHPNYDAGNSGFYPYGGLFGDSSFNTDTSLPGINGSNGYTPGGLPLTPGVPSMDPVNSSGVSPGNDGNFGYPGGSAGGGFMVPTTPPSGTYPGYTMPPVQNAPTTLPNPISPTYGAPQNTQLPEPPKITPPNISIPNTPSVPTYPNYPSQPNTPDVAPPTVTNFPAGTGGTGGTTTNNLRNAYPEGLAQNYAQGQLAPQQLGQYNAYSNANAAIDARNLGTSLFGLGGPTNIADQYAALTRGQQDPLLQQQNRIASDLLNQGGNLSASDLRNVQQASRAGYAARGLDATNSSIVDEAMQTDAAKRNRLIQNMGIASGVVGSNQAQTGLTNANNSSLFNLAGGLTTASNAYTRNQFDPFNQYGQDLANTNFNAVESRNNTANNNALALTIAGLNADAAKGAATTGALGNVFGSLLGNWSGRCWVARAVYGENDPAWIAFKFWLDHRAPAWFEKLYTKHGAKFAKWLKRHHKTKSVVRWWMDGRIASLADEEMESVRLEVQRCGLI